MKWCALISVTSVEVHPMSGSAAGADAGIEVESVATQVLSDTVADHV